MSHDPPCSPPRRNLQQPPAPGPAGACALTWGGEGKALGARRERIAATWAVRPLARTGDRARSTAPTSAVPPFLRRFVTTLQQRLESWAIAVRRALVLDQFALLNPGYKGRVLALNLFEILYRPCWIIGKMWPTVRERARFPRFRSRQERNSRAVNIKIYRAGLCNKSHSWDVSWENVFFPRRFSLF